MISSATAMRLAFAWREIEEGTKLLAEVRGAMAKGSERVDIRDAFGRPQGGLQLGVPSSAGSRALFNVPWPLAEAVILAHLAQVRATIEAASHEAAVEAGGLLFGTQTAILVRLEEARDLLAERIVGNPARSSGHNARVLIEELIGQMKAEERARAARAAAEWPQTDDQEGAG